MNQPTNSETKKLVLDTTQTLIDGNYRIAAENIVQHMKTIAEDHDDTETVSYLDGILAQLFDVPNIDWQKAEMTGHYDTVVTERNNPDGIC